MMTRPVGHRRDPNDSGVALLLALFLIVFVGVLAAAALTYAGTSLNASTLVYLPHRSKSADAESAIRAAIQYVKRDQQNGGTLGQDLGLPCPTGTFSYAGASGPVAVTICPQDGSLIQAGEYRASILTLGTDPGEGIKFGSNGQNDVGGSVFSNSIISATGTQLTVNGGRVFAWGGCSGNITISNPTQCNLSTTLSSKPKIALDPADASLGHQADWQPALNAPASMTQPTIPACGGTPTLNPGIYYDPAALSALTTGCDVTLNPGVYFLDFPSSATPWSISRTITAACDGAGQGAQIVFANQSKLNLGATGTLNDLCGRKANANSTTPNIVLYGHNTDAGTPAGPFTTTLRPATATDTGPTNYYSSGTTNYYGSAYYSGSTSTKATPAGSIAYPQDSPASNATATVAANDRTAELTLSSFAPSSGPAVQQNATVSSVVVKVAHNEATNTNFTTKVPRLVWGSCSVNLTPQQSGTSTLWASGNLWTTGTGLSSCAAFTPTAPMSVVWDVTSTTWSSQTIQLDGAQVDVTWTDPGIPELAGCTATVGGCSIIDSTGGQLKLNDVVYLPTAKLAGAFTTDDAYPISSLIARCVDLDDNPNSSGGVQFGTLDPRPELGTVLFQASIAHAPWTDAIATYDPQSTPTLKATIRSWVPRH